MGKGDRLRWMRLNFNAELSLTLLGKHLKELGQSSVGGTRSVTDEVSSPFASPLGGAYNRAFPLRGSPKGLGAELRLWHVKSDGRGLKLVRNPEFVTYPAH